MVFDATEYLTERSEALLHALRSRPPEARWSEFGRRRNEFQGAVDAFVAAGLVDRDAGMVIAHRHVQDVQEVLGASAKPIRWEAPTAIDFAQPGPGSPLDDESAGRRPLAMTPLSVPGRSAEHDVHPLSLERWHDRSTLRFVVLGTWRDRSRGLRGRWIARSGDRVVSTQVRSEGVASLGDSWMECAHLAPAIPSGTTVALTFERDGVQVMAVPSFTAP